ncbi:MAG: EpsD family peptidyl-prolyl cis-trans isomerase [Burkholderiales bacterium]|nr:EpsD family peptidyl-prolyl cis-trans isomerase [Burkholderiales bacterium]
MTVSIRPAALAAALVLAACGKPGTDAAKAPSQVAARVDGVEITVHQINHALARAGRAAADDAKAAGRQALEQLVDQQLLVRKAIDAKLDRNPEVLAALDAARRQVLAQAYMERAVASGTAKPAPDEVRRFYDARPELFAQRSIYRLQEIVASVPEQLTQPLLELVGKTRNLNDIVAFLRRNDVRFNANSAVRPAEQLPLEVLPTLGRMKEGEIGALGGNGRVTIVQLVARLAAPQSPEEATPAIEQFLVSQKRGEVARAELMQLRAAAKLEYVGEFAAPAAPAATRTPPVAPAAATDSAIEKGLKGLR